MLIGGKRVCGKTTELIQKANKDWLYILCADRGRVQNILKVARSMNLDIPLPFTVSELPLKGPHIKGVLIDDIEDVLFQLIGKPVIMASTRLEMKELTSIQTAGDTNV